MTHEDKRRYFDGALIFKQGDPADAMYVVRSGRVGIFRGQDGTDVQIATARPGECFGEMALVDDKPRSATARAIGEVEVEIITAAELKQRIADPVVLCVLTKLSERVRTLNGAVEELRTKSGGGSSAKRLRVSDFLG